MNTMLSNIRGSIFWCLLWLFCAMLYMFCCCFLTKFTSASWALDSVIFFNNFILNNFSPPFLQHIPKDLTLFLPLRIFILIFWLLLTNFSFSFIILLRHFLYLLSFLINYLHLKWLPLLLEYFLTNILMFLNCFFIKFTSTDTALN